MERHASLKETTEQKGTELKSACKKTVTIKLPDLFTSVTAPPARLNLFWKSDVPREADEWAKSVMKLDDKAFARHRKAQLPLLAAGFVPEADADGYRMVCDFMEWVFYFDDLFDEGTLREDPTAARNELEAHLAIHNDVHPEISAEEHPVRHMYQALWKKIQAVSSPGIG
ncbi:hypothetical protein K469DRAFT_211849 [Zopfia rhizophila CBS 207.26]|uniref:Terpenoid synthase n=1 Tax=Zopfia rhizophila CBS 207.26 TaxID=1314779 RepID=A0A6A6D4S9_9PEZI|nr:hypothetical protein K469DRAFT_211849 [Zopfia rhizophila CBS 207.26]